MTDRRLRRIARPLVRPVRAGLQRIDAARARREARRILAARGSWEIEAIHRARSGTCILQLRSDGGVDAFLKLADTPGGAAGLDRERRVLAALASQPRLAELRPMLPEVIDAGQADGWSFLLQRAVPGVTATRHLQDPAHRGRILPQAARFASAIHGSVPGRRPIGQPELAAWIDNPVAAVQSVLGSRRASAEDGRTVDRLAEELRATVGGWNADLGWIHGDFWSENLLIDPANGAVTGVVDWDSADEMNLAAHDQLHLILYGRKTLRGSELGDEVCRAMSDEPAWDSAERPAIDAAIGGLEGRAGERDTLRQVVLLYWLRQVMMNLVRQPAATRRRRWVDENVRSVLACI